MSCESTPLSLRGLKLVGFATWERRDGSGRSVSFPSRQFIVHGDRKNFALPRAIEDPNAQNHICRLLLRAYEAHVQEGVGAALCQTTARDSGRHFPMLRENNVRAGFLEHEHYLAMLKHLPPCMGPVVTFAFVTGWRINSEVLPMEWRQVDLKAGEVRLDPGTTKNLEGRVFYVTPELRKLLEDQRKAAKRIQREKGMIVQHVFFHDRRTQAGEPAYETGQAISPSGFYHAWCRARIAAGRPGSIPHDLRRTAVRNMVRAGIPERVAMKLSGHKTRSVFDRYNIVSDGDLREASRRLEAGAVP